MICLRPTLHGSSTCKYALIDTLWSMTLWFTMFAWEILTRMRNGHSRPDTVSLEMFMTHSYKEKSKICNFLIYLDLNSQKRKYSESPMKVLRTFRKEEKSCKNISTKSSVSIKSCKARPSSTLWSNPKSRPTVTRNCKS